jgi:formylmethanofuran dehydrogenase subunit E
VQKRASGVEPQDIPPEIADPLIDKVLTLNEEDFLQVGPVHTVEVKKKKGLFAAKPCAKCGEMTFVNKLRELPDGSMVCIPCSGYGE